MIYGLDLGMLYSAFAAVDLDLQLTVANEWRNEQMLTPFGWPVWTQGAELVVIEMVEAENFREDTRGYERLKEVETEFATLLRGQGIPLVIAPKGAMRWEVTRYAPRCCGLGKTYINLWLSGGRRIGHAGKRDLQPRARTAGTPAEVFPLYPTGRLSRLVGDDRRDALVCALWGWGWTHGLWQLPEGAVSFPVKHVERGVA